MDRCVKFYYQSWTKERFEIFEMFGNFWNFPLCLSSLDKSWFNQQTLRNQTSPKNFPLSFIYFVATCESEYEFYYKICFFAACWSRTFNSTFWKCTTNENCSTSLCLSLYSTCFARIFFVDFQTFFKNVKILNCFFFLLKRFFFFFQLFFSTSLWVILFYIWHIFIYVTVFHFVLSLFLDESFEKIRQIVRAKINLRAKYHKLRQRFSWAFNETTAASRGCCKSFQSAWSSKVDYEISLVTISLVSHGSILGWNWWLWILQIYNCSLAWNRLSVTSHLENKSSKKRWMWQIEAWSDSLFLIR